MKLFKTKSEKEIKKLQPILKKIEKLGKEMEILSDEALKAKTVEFKNRINNGESLDKILPEAFAVVREADRRVLGMFPYIEQVICGIVLHQGRIGELATGQGKTLVSTMPAYLNALTGKGVHIVTVNDYLAKRDADQMGQVHKFLGLTVGTVLNDSSQLERQIAYSSDITYITNNQLGFDYLRDNMATEAANRVQRGLHFVIMDEVDSVLIDEARTPLIISGASGKSTVIYKQADMFVKSLTCGKAKEFSKMDAIMGEKFEETGDYIKDEKDQVITLTENGIKKAEKMFAIENLSDPENIELQHCINTALRANYLMHKDQHYIVRDGEVMIVDEFTGRVMDGRRFSDGLHQAIEAKEGVEIKEESQTLATVTFQNFFNKYEKKAGMTGTAITEEKEFQDIYGMDVVVIPTHQPVIRKDLTDIVFLTKKEKYEAICNEVEKAYNKRQPVLVGTASIDVSELLDRALSKRGIPHTVLNAKNDSKEAEIVAKAGIAGAVTIATNMAGRGTDIKLDDEAKANGGLKIIGTERHESRRIDNQLRGRSGRQGDPGESRFYLSLEDNLIKHFGSADYYSIYAANHTFGDEITNKVLLMAISDAQRRIEDNNYGIRKNLLEYDLVNNHQREIIYAERNKVIDKGDMRETVTNMVKNHLDGILAKTMNGNKLTKEEYESLNNKLSMINNSLCVNDQSLIGSKKNDVYNAIVERAMDAYKAKEDLFVEPEQMRQLERQVLLRVIDTNWKNHLDDMDQLKQWIGIKSYGQKDPKLEYKRLGYKIFNEMMLNIMAQTVQTIYNIQVFVPAPQPAKEPIIEEVKTGNSHMKISVAKMNLD